MISAILIQFPFPHPCPRYRPSSLQIIHHQNHLMLMVTIKHFDVDSGFSHTASELTELTGNVLLQSLNKHFPLSKDFNASLYECFAGRGTILEKEMSHADTIDNPRSATFNADTSSTQCFAHLGKRPRPVA